MKIGYVSVILPELRFEELPGFGDIDWNKFFSALNDVDYRGAACIEIEDKEFEESLESKIQALQLSKKYISQFVP